MSSQVASSARGSRRRSVAPRFRAGLDGWRGTHRCRRRASSRDAIGDTRRAAYDPAQLRRAGKSSTGDREKMISGPPSGLSGVHGTALSAAALRAWHTLKGAEPKIFRDELALALTGMDEAEVVALGERVSAASASTCVLRSRFTEDHLAAARDRLSQYVVLGAGLDSFALRMGDALGGLTVFEVDDPPFQEWKSQRIQELGLEPPPQLRFVPCDFETTSIADGTRGRRFPRRRTVLHLVARGDAVPDPRGRHRDLALGRRASGGIRTGPDVPGSQRPGRGIEDHHGADRHRRCSRTSPLPR